MATVAKVFRNKGCQYVRIPKAFHFGAGEVFIRRAGESVILTWRPGDWSEWAGSEAVATEWFMDGVAELEA